MRESAAGRGGVGGKSARAEQEQLRAHERAWRQGGVAEQGGGGGREKGAG